MPGYGGGIGGDNAPGNEAGAGRGGNGRGDGGNGVQGGRGVNPGRGYAGSAAQPGGRGRDAGWDTPGGSFADGRSQAQQAQVLTTVPPQKKKGFLQSLFGDMFGPLVPSKPEDALKAAVFGAAGPLGLAMSLIDRALPTSPLAESATAAQPDYGKVGGPVGPGTELQGRGRPGSYGDPMAGAGEGDHGMEERRRKLEEEAQQPTPDTRTEGEATEEEEAARPVVGVFQPPSTFLQGVQADLQRTGEAVRRLGAY